MFEKPAAGAGKVNKDRYNEFHGDYSKEAVLGRLRVITGTELETILDGELNKKGLSLENVENLQDEFSDTDLQTIAELLSAMVLALDTDDTTSAAQAGAEMALLIQKV